MDLQSGNTSTVKAMCSPLGDRTRFPTSSGRSVTCTASPPSTEIRQTCDDPEREERNRMDRPSGVQHGSWSLAGCEVSRRVSVPSASTSHRSVVPLFFSKSVVRTVNTIWRPSGDTGASSRPAPSNGRNTMGSSAGPVRWFAAGGSVSSNASTRTPAGAGWLGVPVSGSHEASPRA